jgi:hypothetical protein
MEQLNFYTLGVTWSNCTYSSVPHRLPHAEWTVQMSLPLQHSSYVHRDCDYALPVDTWLRRNGCLHNAFNPSVHSDVSDTSRYFFCSLFFFCFSTNSLCLLKPNFRFLVSDKFSGTDKSLLNSCFILNRFPVSKNCKNLQFSDSPKSQAVHWKLFWIEHLKAYYTTPVQSALLIMQHSDYSYSIYPNTSQKSFLIHHLKYGEPPYNVVCIYFH